MNEILDLLPIPSERDLRAAQMTALRDALVTSVAADRGQKHLLRRVICATRTQISRGWLGFLGVFVLGLAITMTGLSSSQSRLSGTSEAMLAAASAPLILVAASPSTARPGIAAAREILLISSGRGISRMMAAG